MENDEVRHFRIPKEQMLIALDYLCEKSLKLGMQSTSEAIKRALDVATSELGKES